MTDPISDMLTRIRNAGRALLPTVAVPHSRLKENIAAILKKEGYVAEVAVEGNTLKTINIKLKYQGKKTVIEGLRRVSRPGLRHYVGATKIPPRARRSRGGGDFDAGGRHDGRAGPQEKPGRRVALLHLVRILCRELENSR